jgi:hypothetical protein
MKVICAGCGKEKNLGRDILYEISLSLKQSGYYQLDENGKLCSESELYCEKCHSKSKDVKKFKGLVNLWRSYGKI